MDHDMIMIINDIEKKEKSVNKKNNKKNKKDEICFKNRFQNKNINTDDWTKLYKLCIE